MPGFPIYESQIAINGAVPVPLYICARAATRLRPERARVEDHAENETADPQQSANQPAASRPRLISRRSVAILQASADLGFLRRDHGRFTFEGSFQLAGQPADMQERCIISDGRRRPGR